MQYDPAGQMLQASDCVLDPVLPLDTVPGGQGTTEYPSGQKVPAAHSLPAGPASTDIAGQENPGSHFKHSVADASDQNPAGQGISLS